MVFQEILKVQIKKEFEKNTLFGHMMPKNKKILNFQRTFCIGNHYPSYLEGIQSYWNEKQVVRHQFQF